MKLRYGPITCTLFSYIRNIAVRPKFARDIYWILQTTDRSPIRLSLPHFTLRIKEI